jgi:hypothetical protein
LGLEAYDDRLMIINDYNVVVDLMFFCLFAAAVVDVSDPIIINNAFRLTNLRQS